MSAVLHDALILMFAIVFGWGVGLAALNGFKVALFSLEMSSGGVYG